MKLYFNNIRFSLNFTSYFKFWNGFLNYSEETDVLISVENINSLTVFLKFEVDNDTKAVNITIEKAVMNGDPKNIKFNVTRGQGMFIH